MANIFKRVRPSGFYAWYVRYRDPVTGVDIKRSAGKTKADADRLLTQIKGEIHEGTYESKQRQSKVKFFEIADDFLAYSRARKRSWVRDERSVTKLKEFFGDVPCCQIKRSMIDQFIASRKTEKGHNGNLIQSSTVNRELACLKTIFRRAYMDGKIAYNPLAGFKLLEEDNVRDRVLAEEEFQKLLFAAPAYLRPVLITAWETGMRKGEILNLQWKQIDFKREAIMLSGDGTKTGKSRVVPISGFLMNTLKKQKRINEWVFNHNDKHFTDIRFAFDTACNQAGIDDFRFHDLRHCFVTRKRREGHPDRVIMKVTGHQTMECFKRYDSITFDDLKRVVENEGEKSWNTAGTRGNCEQSKTL